MNRLVYLIVANPALVGVGTHRRKGTSDARHDSWPAEADCAVVVMGPAELFAEVADLSLGAAALRYAQAGVPVFPCLPGGKNPLTSNGFHDATANPAQIAAWWRRWPNANIGLPTGQVSGVEVVDVDRKRDGDGFAAFTAARRGGLVGGALAVVRTPSGGVHSFHPVDPARAQRSWQAVKAHVDFRGDGGYVVVPPSVVVQRDGSRSSYVLAAAASEHPLPVDAVALREFLDPRPAASATSTLRRSGPMVSDAQRLAAWVALRGEGERNRGLFWAACRLGEAGLSLPELLDALGAAGEHAGLAPREVTTTIRSAYRTTHAAPAPAGRGQPEAPRQAAGLVGQVLA